MTTEELVAELKATEADSAILAAAWARALAVIEKDVDWYFGEPRPVLERLDGSLNPRKPRTTVFLRQYPVGGALTALHVRAGTEWETVDSDDYELQGRRLIHETYWPFGSRILRASYNEGFTVIPGDIAQLALAMVREGWLARGGNEAAVGGATLGPKISESIGDYSYTRANLSQQSTGSGSGSSGLQSLWDTVRNNWRRARI